MIKDSALLTILAALNCEAKPWIDFYGLKKVCSKPFSLYQSDDVEVVISGIGATAMATAVGWVGAQGQRSRTWLNLGTAGHATRPLGDIFRVHGSARSEQSRAHYPPLTARWNGSTDALLSVDTPSHDYPGGAAVDMEANAFFDAATRFSSAELVQSVKVVSDNENHGFEALNAAKITMLMQPHVELVDAFGKALCDLVQAPAISRAFDDLMSIKATFSQHQQLSNLLHKVSVLGLEAQVAAQNLSPDQSVKTVLATLHTLVEQATPVLTVSKNG